MAEIRTTTKVALRLERALQNIEALQPPPPPRARYALAKAAQKVEDSCETYRKQLKLLYEDHSHKDEKGKAKFTKLDDRHVKYDVIDQDALKEQEDALLAEEVVLVGVRAVTQEELGACPVTVQDLKMLLGTLVVDAEPKGD